MVSGYLSRVKAARMPGYEPPTMTQGVALGLRSSLGNALRLKSFAKKGKSARAWSLLRYWKCSGGVSTVTGKGVDSP